MAASRQQFLRVYDIDMGTMKSIVGPSKPYWTDFWDMFSEIYTKTTTESATGKTTTQQASRLKSDLSQLQKYFADEIKPLRMLPKVNNVGLHMEIPKLIHAIPPVAPIYVSSSKFESVNQNVEAKHLQAFIDGHTDTECVAAARKCLSKLTKAPKKPTTSARTAKQKARTIEEFKINAQNQAHFATIAKQTALDSGEPEHNAADEATKEYIVLEACIGVQLHRTTKKSASIESIYVGLEWAPGELLPGEDSILWQNNEEMFDNDDDFMEAFQETWTVNRAEADNCKLRRAFAFFGSVTFNLVIAGALTSKLRTSVAMWNGCRGGLHMFNKTSYLWTSQTTLMHNAHNYGSTQQHWCAATGLTTCLFLF